jgi:hypothetical protein
MRSRNVHSSSKVQHHVIAITLKAANSCQWWWKPTPENGTAGTVIGNCRKERLILRPQAKWIEHCQSSEVTQLAELAPELNSDPSSFQTHLSHFDRICPFGLLPYRRWKALSTGGKSNPDICKILLPQKNGLNTKHSVRL